MQRAAVVMPVFHKQDVTRQAVADCRRESELVEVVIVDNGGDLDPAEFPDCVVLTPGENLGWLRGTNLGMEHALERGSTSLVALNNDIRLSENFFSGLLTALEARPGDLVAPSYDDVYSPQNSYFKGAPQDFTPASEEVEASIIDGTCFAVTASRWRQLGPLDERNFARRGWGGMTDYVIRNTRAGGKNVVTRRAYLTHARGTTAKATMSNYRWYAASEMRTGLRRKYGANWRTEVYENPEPPEGLKVRLHDHYRMVRDRFDRPRPSRS
ncbi:glycosyltransferase [Kineococcus sp. R86509]|uniref:glycosyltransferase n=1 Tax=Kineococcus sp. R86509 TaxID=3093851 RepID=UPI0036D3FDC6